MMPACKRDTLDNMETVTLLPEEIEAIRLADLMDLDQEEVACMMGVSRKTAWKDIHNARKKIADAIINGKAIRIQGCESTDTEDCGIEICKKMCRGKQCWKLDDGIDKKIDSNDNKGK
jgi:hypothetical protein